MVAVFGGLVTLSTALLAASNAQELWVRQRGNHQQLQSERFLYLTGAGPYMKLDEKEGVRLFSARLMTSWSAGHGRWQKVVEDTRAADPSP